MKQIYISLLCFLSVCTLAFPVYDATNWIQNAAIAEHTLDAVKQQARMIELQIRALKSLKHYHYRDVQSLLQQVDDIARRGATLSQNLKVLDEQFQTIYPNYNRTEAPNESAAHIQQRNQTTMDTLRHSLQAIGETVRTLDEENRLIQRLETQNQQRHGQTAVLQVTNQLVSESLHQIQLLRRLAALQAKSQTAYHAHQLSKATHTDQALKAMTSQMDDIPSSHSKGFG